MRGQRRLPAPPEDGLIGHSAPMVELRRLIDRVAPTEATVLILGERGTGKELVARAIQRQSRRQDKPFVIVNCAALPVDLLAGELFGHERGAFTGAVQRSTGLLGAAEGGTVFLDEIGDLSPQGQAMLLRFLQDREVRPLGSARAVRLDVRVIAATNRELAAAVERGEFRADLYDRISDVVLWVQPLRERREDIVALAQSFVARYSCLHRVAVRGLSREATESLRAYDWPGNVRQLEKTVSRAVIFASGQWITPPDLELPGTDAWSAKITDQTRGLTQRQREIVRIASIRGAVGRGDVMARFGVSGEAARRDLVELARAGIVERLGRGRGSRYRPSPAGDPR